MSAPNTLGTNRDFRVVIVGGGIAGLTLANALQSANIDYVLLESRKEIAPQVGASIGIFANGARILDQLGLFDSINSHVEPIVSGAGHWASGDYISQRNGGPLLGEQRTGYPAAFLDRQIVLRVLADNLTHNSKVLLGKKMSAVEHSSDGVVVHCADGSKYEGDIVVGADGVWSPVRQAMWRCADIDEPGAIPAVDRTALSAEYICLYGISSATDGLTKGWYDVTYAKDVSTMTIIGQEGRVFFFVFKKLDKVHKQDEIPKYSQAEAEAFADQNLEIGLMPEPRVTFGDIWKNRLSYTLVTLEEAEYKKWTWGRFVCIGDGIHKITPNAGAGGNASIESAAAVANVIKELVGTGKNRHPPLEAVAKSLRKFQKLREVRMAGIAKMANGLTRIQALNGLSDQIMARYVIPNAGDHLTNMQADTTIGAVRLDYLPPPSRSLDVLMPFNPEQGLTKEESTLKRLAMALPFLGLSYLAYVYIMQTSFAAIMPALEESVRNGTIRWDTGSLPIRESFYGVKAVDDLWRGIVVAFSPSTLGYDPVGSWQMFSFLADVGVLYAIWTVESARRANLLTLVQIPLLFGLIFQFIGIGVVAPIYYLIHYATTPISKFKASDLRLTNLAYTRCTLPVFALAYHLPLLGAYFSPSPSARHSWTWLWQMFPVWVSVLHRLLAATVVPDTVQQDKLHAVTRDLKWIRASIGALALFSAAVWLRTLTSAPFSALSIFVPDGLPARSFVEHARKGLQWDQVFCFGASYLWLAYLFFDLRQAGMVSAAGWPGFEVGWLRFLAGLGVATGVGGPGFAVAVGWLAREEVLARRRHWGAVVAGGPQVADGEKQELVADGKAGRLEGGAFG